MKKPKVAFVCVHNSCRSQMAEAISKINAKDEYIAYSAGTHVKPQINQDATRIILDKYGVDMNQTQNSKLINQIPTVDIVITMGCNVNCPHLPCKFREDWGLDDPSGKSDEEFIKTMNLIEDKIENLKTRIKQNKIEEIL